MYTVLIEITGNNPVIFLSAELFMLGNRVYVFCDIFKKPSSGGV